MESNSAKNLESEEMQVLNKIQLESHISDLRAYLTRRDVIVSFNNNTLEIKDVVVIPTITIYGEGLNITNYAMLSKKPKQAMFSVVLEDIIDIQKYKNNEGQLEYFIRTKTLDYTIARLNITKLKEYKLKAMILKNIILNGGV